MTQTLRPPSLIGRFGAESRPWPRLSTNWSDPAEFGLEPEQMLAHGGEMGLATLELERHGMNVAHAPLEWARGEDRGGAGGVVNGLGHLLRLPDGVGHREPDRHAGIEAERVAALCLVPPFGDRSEEIHARGAQACLGIAQLHLRRAVVAQRSLE